MRKRVCGVAGETRNMVEAPEFDILGIGTVAVDDVIHVGRYPEADLKEPVVFEERQFGGQIGTALASAAAMGAACAYAGVLGDDELSAAVEGGLRAAGVDCSHLVKQDGAGPIHSTIVADDSTHTRNIFFNLGPIRPLPPVCVTPELIGSARVLLVDQLGVETHAVAADCARGLGVPVVGDMEWPDAPGWQDLIGLIDHLILPLDFARAVTGLIEPSAIVRNLHASAPRACTAVTYGADGCFFLTAGDDTVRRQKAFAVRVVETTGCGDVFHGAYCVALARGQAPQECMVWAAAAAAAHAAHPSGWSHLPSRAEVEALIHRRNGT